MDFVFLFIIYGKGSFSEIVDTLRFVRVLGLGAGGKHPLGVKHVHAKKMLIGGTQVEPTLLHSASGAGARLGTKCLLAFFFFI